MAGEDEKTMMSAVLVGIITDGVSAEQVNSSLSELGRLLETAGGEVYCTVTQSKSTLDARTLIGSGKVGEISEICRSSGVGLVVFDEELSPSQIRNLEDDIGEWVRVIDRSMLILDIFALHAVSGEGKLQVELAQLKYTAPRLIGSQKDMSRLGGGIGTRGPGESKLESDRRHIRRRITALEEEIAVMDKNRRVKRASRDRSEIPQIAIVGYTNAGKSTLLNRLTDAGILAQDKLFATLDPTTRRLTLPCGDQVLLTDTVGFIRKLPHHLVSSFKSTLDEAVYADIIMIMCDASDPEWRSQLECTEATLEELGAAGKPTLYVFNKCDCGVDDIGLSVSGNGRCVYISALTGEGCDGLLEAISEVIHEGCRRVVFKIPNSELGALNMLYKNATVEDVVYEDTCAEVTAIVDARVYGMMKKYDGSAIETD